jgi:hypothetical protein
MIESMGRRARRNGDEYDAFASKTSRDSQPAFSRAGVRAATKNRANRRSRRSARLELRMGAEA